MVETSISVGSIVHLNSGSSCLKVVALSGHKVEVEWSNELGRLERMTLLAVCFRLI